MLQRYNKVMKTKSEAKIETPQRFSKLQTTTRKHFKLFR